MRRSTVLALPVAAIGIVLCAGWMSTCPDALNCTAAFGAPLLGGSLMAYALAVLLVSGIGGWAARTAWLVAAAHLAARRIPAVPMPAALQEAIVRTGAARVICLDDAKPSAFCAGLFRPGIFVSEALVWALRAEELDAVLLHEAEHSSRRDPLRRAAGRALSELLFFLPLVRWWTSHRIDASELAADRVVLERIGPRPLAGALWATSRMAMADGMVAFSGAASLRVAQLTGAPLPSRMPELQVWVSSGMGLLMAGALGSCLLHLASSL